MVGAVAATGERVAGERRRLAGRDAVEAEAVEEERAREVVRAREAVHEREIERRGRAAACGRGRAVRPQGGGGPVARDGVRGLGGGLRQDARSRRRETDVVHERGDVAPPAFAREPYRVRARREPDGAGGEPHLMRLNHVREERYGRHVVQRDGDAVVEVAVPALVIGEGEIVPSSLGDGHFLHDRSEALEDAELVAVRDARAGDAAAPAPGLHARAVGQHHLLGHLPRRDGRVLLVRYARSRFLAVHVDVAAAGRRGLERAVREQASRLRALGQRLDCAARRRRAEVRAARPGDEECPLRRKGRTLRERHGHRACAALRKRRVAHQLRDDGVGRARNGRGQVAGKDDAPSADERRAVA